MLSFRCTLDPGSRNRERLSSSPSCLLDIGTEEVESFVRATEGMRRRGGNRRGRRETAVDESRKEMADRVARHQAG